MKEYPGDSNDSVNISVDGQPCGLYGSRMSREFVRTDENPIIKELRERVVTETPVTVQVGDLVLPGKVRRRDVPEGLPDEYEIELTIPSRPV